MLKLSCLVAAFICSCSVFAVQLGGAAFLYEADCVEVTAEGVSCREDWRVVDRINFDSAKGWRIDNYSKRLSIAVGNEFLGERCLYVGGATNRRDTAWNAKSPRFAVPKGIGRCRVQMKVYSDKMLSAARQPLSDISRERWQNAVYWYDGSGKEIGTGPFTYFTAGEGRFADAVSELTVPPDAVGGVLRFGFDSPNLGPGEKVAFADAAIAVPPGGVHYVCRASFVSEMREGGDISWVAETPHGTSVRFQWRGAKDPKELLSLPFKGPDGTGRTAYSRTFKANAPYVQYRAILVSDGAATPVLKSVTVGKRIDSDWLHAIDNVPPEVWRAMDSPVLEKNPRLAFAFKDESFVDWTSVKIKVDEEDATSRFIREGDVLREREPRPSPYAEGLHKVEIFVADCRGNSVTAHKTFFVGTALAVPKCTLRGDGMALIDGKPFFPIGLYGMCAREFNGNSLDKAFADIKAAGFNFAQTYGRAYASEFLAAARKHDVKLWVGWRKPDSNFMKKGRSFPQVLAWYLGDDTSEHATPQEVRDRHDAVTSIDPNRLTCQADVLSPDWQVSRYARFVTATDVFMPEIYPVKEQKGHPSDITCVADTIFEMERIKQDMARFGDGKVRACWPILQWFKGWGNWHHFPTREQLFATSFAAIIHGANGITWYTYGGFYDKKRKKNNEGVTSTPERWQAICDLAGWIRELSPVLLSGPCEQPAVPEILSGSAKDFHGQPSVTALLKRHDGKAYLIAVNAAYEKVRARFRIENAGPVAEVMREGRTLRCPQGIIEDDFWPFGVHVYCINERK